MTVTMTGPLFDGRAEPLVEHFLTDTEEDIAQEGENRVHARLGQVLRHPTGHYESRVQTDRSVGDISITDSGIVYGPWLEGVSRRNQTTSFKGYHTFRIVGQQLDADAGRMLQQRMPRLIQELGG